MAKVGDLLENLVVEAMGSQGLCVAKSPEGKVIFIKNAAPGDIVTLKIYKKEKRFFLADIQEILHESKHRIVAKCSYAGVCGGCQWQHVSYDQQVKAKHQQVIDQLERIGQLTFPKPNFILGSDPIYYYRNKLDFAFANKKWLRKKDLETESPENGLGFHIAGRFDKVLDIETCHLMEEPANKIKNEIRSFALKHDYTFYDYKLHEGDLRGLIIRKSTLNQWMVIVIFGYADESKREALLTHIRTSNPDLHSLMYVINHKKNDTIYDLDVLPYSGEKYIWEKMENLTFRVGPKSFFQTNSTQALKLYQIVRELAGLKPTDIVFDLYTGTGTIALFMARYVAKVIGVEFVESAVEDAKANAEINEIKNVAFFAGDMSKVLTTHFIRKNGKPDIIITDPPRGGMHEKVVETLLAISAPRIVYISCNPATQARDVKLLSEKYAIKAVQPVDMFPHTYHVENVLLLELR